MIETEKDPILMAIAILNHNEGSSFVKDAIKLGLKGGLVSPATGLINSVFLNLLSIRHDRRDLVVLFERQSKLLPTLDTLAQKRHMDLPHHGIMIVIKTQFGLRNDCALCDNTWHEQVSPYQLMLMSFRHGKVGEVLDKLDTVLTDDEQVTIFTGKGEHYLEQQQLLGMSFAPQKDMLLNVVRESKVMDVMSVMEDAYCCTQTKGMYVYATNLCHYSKTDQVYQQHADKLLLLSIVNDTDEEQYVEKMKQLGLHGGTSLNAFGAMSTQKMTDAITSENHPQQKIILSVDSANKIEEAYHVLVNSQKNDSNIYMTLPIIRTYGLYEK